MKAHRRLMFLFAAAALIATLPSFGQVSDWKEIKSPPLRSFNIPEPERYQMKNGLVVMLMEDHELPLVQVQARIRTGSRLEPADKAGLASITGQVLRTGGAGSRNGDEMDELLEGRGARVETSIGIDSGTASVSCLKADFPAVLAVFADVLRSPRFDEAKIKIAKNQAKTTIARRNDEPMGIMQREGARLVYGADSPYGRMTEYATIDAITQADLKAFHAAYFMPNRIYLGVVGDFDTKEMKALLEKTFGSWPKGSDVKDPEAAYQKSPKPGVYRIVKTDMTQSDVIMGHLGIIRSNPDYFAASVMNEVLSGSFAARLFNNIRTAKGLAYSVRGVLDSNYDYPGTFNLWLTTKTETTGAATDALLAEVDALTAKPPTEEEMTRAKQSIVNSFVFNFDSKAKILGQQLTYEYFGYPIDFLTRYRQNIEKVTAADVARVAKTYVKKSDLAILVVGKPEGLDKPLESYGKVASIDITIPEPSSAGTAVASAPGMSDKESAAKGAAILKSVIAAFGGEAKIDGVRNYRVVANTSLMTPRGEMQMKATQVYVLPDKVRQEMASPMGSITTVVTPADAFVVTPMGIQSLPDSRRADLIKAVNHEPIAILKKRGEASFAVKYEGKDTIDTTAAEVIAVTAGGETVRWAVEPATGHVLRSSFQGTGPGGVPGERASFYSDFRDASGLTLPYKSRLTFNGESFGNVETLEVAINAPVDDGQFARPAAAAAGAPPSGGK